MISVKKNYIFNTIYNLMAIIIPFITTPYISRVLGPEGVGAYSYTYSIAFYFVLFTMLGVSKYGSRTIASVRDDHEQLCTLFSEIYIMQSVTGLVASTAYVISVLFVFQSNAALLWIQLIYVVSATFDISWLFFGLEQFKITVIRNIIIRILNAILLFMFVRVPQDVIIYCIIMSVSNFATQVSLWPIALRRFVEFKKPTLFGVLRHLKMNLLLFIPTIAVSIYKIMDKVMLGAIVNEIEVGYYENAEKIINIPMTLITALGTVMLPRMSYFVATNNRNEEKRYIDISMCFIVWIASALSFGILGVADKFVPLFLGEKFNASILITSVLAPTMICISWGNTVSNQILIPRRKDRSYITVVIIGAIINLCLNYLLIPQVKAKGAAFATLITEAIVMIGYTIAAHSYFQWKKYVMWFVIYSSIGVSMSILIRQCPPITKLVWLDLFLLVFGGAVYFIIVSGIITAIFNRDFFMYVNKQVKQALSLVRHIFIR